jgi:hypothetical protein
MKRLITLLLFAPSLLALGQESSTILRFMSIGDTLQIVMSSKGCEHSYRKELFIVKNSEDDYSVSYFQIENYLQIDTLKSKPTKVINREHIASNEIEAIHMLENELMELIGIQSCTTWRNYVFKCKGEIRNYEDHSCGSHQFFSFINNLEKQEN